MLVGTRLRDARLSRNLTLHDISRVTKISVRILESIDRDDLAAIPGDFFARAFLRAYAAEVGLDPVEIVGDYMKQLSPETVRPVEPQETTAPAAASQSYVGRLVLALAVCAMTGLGAWGFVHYQRQSRNSAPSASTPAAQSLGVGSTETSAAAAVSTPDKPEESSAPLVTASSSKPGESETSPSASNNGRPSQSKPAPRERVQTPKPAGSDSSEPAAADTSNQPVAQPPVEATAAVPPDEPNPNQGRIQ